jgi:hypothetical protein
MQNLLFTDWLSTDNWTLFFTASRRELALIKLSRSVNYCCLPLYSLRSNHCTENIRRLAMDICELHRKHLLWHRFYCCVRVLLALPRNRSTLLLVELFVAGLFTEAFPSNGSTCHNIKYLIHRFVIFRHSLQSKRKWRSSLSESMCND